jgi:hypothetical protein
MSEKKALSVGGFQWRVWNGERELLGGVGRIKIYYIYVYIYGIPYVNIGGWHNEIH